MSPTAGIEAIAGLILISLHLKKLVGHHHLRYASIPSNHAINGLLDPQHTKNLPPHRFALLNLSTKQRQKLISSITDINNCLSEITPTFDPFRLLFSPGLRLVV